jgi:membrane fusion protein, multidrug efflux system
MKRNTAVFLSTSIVAVAVVGSLYGALSPRLNKTPSATTEPAAVPVVAAPVKSSDVPIYLDGVGTVIAYNTDLIRSQITGELVQIAFTEGQTVKPGDLLAVIDPRPYEAQLQQMIANRDRDQAQLQNALANLGRYTDLQSKGFASSQLSDTQRAQVEQLKAAIQADEALIAQAKVQLSYTKLVSPIPGVTGVRQIDVGNIIHPTDPNGLVVVTQIEPISLIFTLPETSLPLIQQQQEKTKQPLSVIAYSQNNKIKLDEGSLLLVNNQILQTTGSVQLKANFPNKEHHLWPGQLVNVRLLVDTRHNGLTVPESVVQRGPNDTYAYVIRPDNTVEVRPIKVAQISEGLALIDSGLAANERVVTDGQYKLVPSARVNVLTGKAAEEVKAQTAQQAPIP